MKLVRATNASIKLNKKLKEFHRIVREGEEFVVSNERYAYLNGGNPYRAVFVTLLRDLPEGATQSTVTESAPAMNRVETETVVTPAVEEEEPEVVIIKPKKTTKKKTVE